MRRTFLALAVLLLVLCACGKKEAAGPYTVERYGRTYTVDQEARTVVYQGVSYAFDLSTGGGSGYSVTFTAPDGSTAFWQQSEHLGSGGWSGNWDESISPGDLADALKAGPARHSRQRSGNPLAGLVLVLIGVFNLAAPEAAWYLSHGWRYRDTEPSDAALAMGRIGGGAAVLAGVVFLFL